MNHHLSGDKHWQLDDTYRVHQGLPIFNKLQDPMELSDDRVRNCFLVLSERSPRGVVCLRIDYHSAAVLT